MFHSIWDIVFPIECISCERYGSYICNPCLSRISFCDTQHEYMYTIGKGNEVLEKLVKHVRDNFIKDAAIDLAGIVQRYIDSQDFKNYSVLPYPVDKKEIRLRGYDQNAEIARLLPHTGDQMYVVVVDMLEDQREIESFVCGLDKRSVVISVV